MNETGAVPAPQAPRTRTRRSTIVLAVIAVVSRVAFATVFAFAVTRLGTRGSNPPLRPTGIPASVSTKLAGMMQLSPLPVAPAPRFTLTDQSGRPESLASFRGRPVVLTFRN